MSTATMNISLPESLKRFVKQRTKSANYSNPSDYVRALIRDDQRREVAERLLEDLVAKHVAASANASAASIEKLKQEYWLRWNSLKAEIDKGLESLERIGGRAFDRKAVDAIKRRGRARLAKSKTA